MPAKNVKLILAIGTIVGFSNPTIPAHAISAAQRRMQACTFDQGSVALSPECQLKLTQIATCWTHPRVLFGLSPDEEQRWLANRTFTVSAYAASNERRDGSWEQLVAQRGAAVVNYLTTLGVPLDRITLGMGERSAVSDDPRSRFVLVSGCYEEYYRRGSYTYAKSPDPADPKSLICPLPGEDIDYPSSGSYTSFGKSLDFEPLPMGMIRSSSPGVVHCSDTPLPVYKHYTLAEAERLRVLVQTPAWKQQVTYRNISYLQAYTQQVLGEDDLMIAQSMLQAVWSAKPDNRIFLLTKAVESWSKVAVRQQHDEDWTAANWLQVDLNRQLGNFAAADLALEHFQTLVPAERRIVTDAMLSRERRLIDVRNSKPYAATAQYPDP